MKLVRWNAFLVGVLATLSFLGRASGSVQSDTNSSDGLALPASTGLRGSGDFNHLTETITTQLVEASTTAVAKLSLEERAVVMENLHNSVNDVANFLANLDLVGPGELSQDVALQHHSFQKQISHVLESSKEARLEAIDFVRNAAVADPASGTKASKTKNQRRRAQEKTFSEGKKHGKPNRNGTRFKASSFTDGFFNDIHRVLKTAGEDIPGSKNFLHHASGLHQDFRAGSSKTKFYGKPVLRRGDHRSGRQLSTEQHDEMCTQLANCVSSMSRYDMFVYFRSDDIDDATGEVDESLVFYDDADLLQIYEDAKAQAKSVLEDASPDVTKCSELLQMFHRVIELEDVPKWEGATVSQVCHAEGTPVYVKLGQAAAASVDITGFRQKAWAHVARRINQGNSLWDSTGKLLKAVSVARNGDAVGLDKRGRVFERKTDFNEDTDTDQDWWDEYPLGTSGNIPFSTPLQDISVAELGWVGIDLNGAIYKRDVTRHVDIMGNVGQLHQLDVGSDGSVWGILRMATGLNRLFQRRGDSWRQEDTCGHNFKSVHVGDKNHIWLIQTNKDIYEYQAGKSCAETKFTVVYGHAEWVSIAVDSSGEEKGIFHVGGGNIWALDKTKNRAASNAWRQIEHGDWATVSSDGYGNIYATHQNGKLSKWTGPNLDEYDWSQPWQSSYNEKFQNGHVINPPSGGRYKSVSVAANGDVCAILDVSGDDVLYCGTSSGFNGLAPESPSQVDSDLGAGVVALGVSKYNMYLTSSSGRAKRRAPRGMNFFYDTATRKEKFLAASIADDGSVWALVASESTNGVEMGQVWKRQYDESDNFERVDGGSSPGFVDISAIDQKNAWALGIDGSVHRTTDGGTSWTEIARPKESVMHKIEAGEGVWAVDKDKNIYRFNPASTATDGSAWILENNGDDHFFVDVGVGKATDVVAIKSISKDAHVGSTQRYMGVEAFFDHISTSFENAVKTFAEEPLFCARDLFESTWRKQKSVIKYESTGEYTDGVWGTEPFVFGINGNDPGTDIKKYRIPVGVDTKSPGRNAHGQLLSMDDPGFEYETYNDLLVDYRECSASVVAEFDSNLDEALVKTNDEEEAREVFEEHINGFLDNFGTSCIAEALFNKIETGLSLVFGTQPSPGFICGIKDATLAQPSDAPRNEIMPGYCCLDAPYELQGDDWGHKYDCSTATKCENVGPFFAGMSVEACDAQGGIWCPLPTNCAALKTCIADDLASAAEYPAYASYLERAPIIDDPNDFFQCGRTREYFGYKENFLNDAAICDDIFELRFTKNFDILNNFFGVQDPADFRGAGNTKSSYAVGFTPIEVEDLEVDPVEPPDIPDFLMAEVDTSASSDKTVQKGQAWRATNHALSTTFGTMEFIASLTKEFKCPDDLTGAIQSACAFACNAKMVIGEILLHLFGRIMDISEFTYGEKAELGNVEPIESGERVAAIYGNMEYTGQYIQERFHDQNIYLQEHHNNIGNALKLHQEGIGDALEEHHQNVAKMIGSTCSGGGSASPKRFDLQVEILSSSNATKQVLVLTTHDGSVVDFHTLVIRAVSEDNTLVGVTYTPTDLGDVGRVLLTFESSDTVFFFDATVISESIEYAQSKLLSFGACGA